jgi:hypothetical protein
MVFKKAFGMPPHSGKDRLYIVNIKVNNIELVVQLFGNIAMASTLPVNRLHINHGYILYSISVCGEYSNIFKYSNIFYQILDIRIRILKFSPMNIFGYLKT